MLVVPLRFLLQPAVKGHIHRFAADVDVRAWSTSSFGTPTRTSQLELIDLSDHLDHCRRSSGKLFSALCLSDRMNSFLASRIITTLAVIAMAAVAVFAVV